MRAENKDLFDGEFLFYRVFQYFYLFADLLFQLFFSWLILLHTFLVTKLYKSITGIAIEINSSLRSYVIA
jgi:hypothetical protein